MLNVECEILNEKALLYSIQFSIENHSKRRFEN